MKYYVVDAFTDKVFSGNPAGVCLLDKKISDETMQKIAFENNLSETASLLLENGRFNLRWFSPMAEIDLCGHATLATAFVLFSFVDPKMQKVEFETMSGVLSVTRYNSLLSMDFQSRIPSPTNKPDMLEDALGCKVIGTYLSRDLLALVEDQKAVENLKPDMDLLKKAADFAVIVTAKGEEYDFVSRFFAPNEGINEDPVTGSAHYTLIPFWSKKLGKKIMTAKQLSKRGGILYCEDLGERVKIGGNAVLYSEGEIMI